MELRHLRYFVAVARERSFTRAARVLNIAQPPLSRQIQQLEEEVGSPLMERGSRPLVLTLAGTILFEQAVQVLERVEELKVTMTRLKDVRSNRFSVGFVASVLYARLPEVLRRYRIAQPNVELNLVELTSFEQIIALKEGRIDVGFGRMLFDDPAVARVLMRRERLIVALPQQHPLAAEHSRLRIADLAGLPVIIYPKAPRPSYADQIIALYRRMETKPSRFIEVRELQTALGLVAAEGGLCIVPASLESFRRDSVVYRPLDEPDATSPIIMSHRLADTSADVLLLIQLIHDIYDEVGIEFGA